jgi:CheY-like chemotaxis protein
MATRIAWWLNFDAPLELEQAGRYTPSPRVSERARQLVARMRTLVSRQDVILDGSLGAKDLPGFIGLAFCCTPSAREALTHLTGGQPVTVLLSDIAMPGEDGYELIQQVRALSARVAGLPAIAITACASAEERERALAAGFQMHLAKPILPETLVNAVAALAEVATAVE